MSQLAALGNLMSNETRAGILTILMDGRAHTGGELARHLRVSPSTASEHLSKLLDGGMVVVEPQNRHRYFRLANAEIADLLESMDTITVDLGPTPPPRAPAALTYARTCYDHLAGELAVEIYDHLLASGYIQEVDHNAQLTKSGHTFFEELGIGLHKTNRPMAKYCLDWTQRRHHLAGTAGSALLDHMLNQGWANRGPQPRSIRISQSGKKAVAQHFT